MITHGRTRLPIIALLAAAIWAVGCCERPALASAECSATRVPGTNNQVVSCTVADAEGSANDTIPMPQ